MPKSSSISTVVDVYSAASAAQLSGLSLVMVNHLCRHKMVMSTGSTKRGRGRARQYTYTDVLLLRVIQKLLTQGISVLRLKKCLTALQRNEGHVGLLTKKFVATNGVHIYFGNGEILEQLGSGQMAFAFVIELKALRDEVARLMQTRKAA
jgi:DNA-binding transcriptional MerR regulator